MQVLNQQSDLMAGFIGGCFKGLVSALLVGVLLGACSSSVETRKPEPLVANPATLAIRKAWTVQVGEATVPVHVAVVGNDFALASSSGTVAVLNGNTGADVWRVRLGNGIEAGPGFDGKYVAVVAQGGGLIVFADGKELWRTSVNASVVTAPLVAGNRIFVLASDRSVSAWDAATGRQLWQQQRGSETLVLKQAALMTAVGDTLVVAQGARLVGLNPLNGSIRWEQPVASSRGTNEIEKLSDVVAGIARHGTDLCVRAYQHAVTCVESFRPSLRWTKASSGASGVAGDEHAVFGADGQGVLSAYSRVNGDVLWTSNQLRYRQLTAPAVIGRSVVIGDAQGNIHLMAKTDGTLLNRLTTDTSPIMSTPTLVGKTLVVVTQRGGVFGFVPE